MCIWIVVLNFNYSFVNTGNIFHFLLGGVSMDSNCYDYSNLLWCNSSFFQFTDYVWQDFGGLYCSRCVRNDYCNTLFPFGYLTQRRCTVW